MNRETESMEPNQTTFEILKAAMNQWFCLQKSGQTIHIYRNYFDLLNALYKKLSVNILYFIDLFLWRA